MAPNETINTAATAAKNTMSDTATLTSGIMDLAEAEALCANLKRITVHSEQALIKGDAREGIEQVERWVESYRRGLSAAQKISVSGIDLLKKTREQLALSLEERLRLEDEGGNPPTKEQAAENEELAKAITRIDGIMAALEQSFQSPQSPQSPQSQPEAA
ncbi:MAG: hypothetical protein ACOYNL_06365 [Rickettsiales bacterium]